MAIALLWIAVALGAFAANSLLARLALAAATIDAASFTATVQLAVPILAAAGAVAFLGEPVTLRLVVASAAIVGGVALAIFARRPL